MPCARSPWRVNFVRWHLYLCFLILSLKSPSCHYLGVWNLEVPLDVYKICSPLYHYNTETGENKDSVAFL